MTPTSVTVSTTDASQCPVCGPVPATRWGRIPGQLEIYRCTGCSADCGVWQERTESGPVEHDHFEGLDRSQYAASVEATRRRSYPPLLARVQRFVPEGNWLDVGCSFGWLLRYLQETPFRGYGVEPSPGAAAEARSAGLAVQEGLFPQCSGEGSPYQVVSFLDVLEHLQRPGEALSAARSILAPGGVLVLQVPDQSCLLYRLAEWMHRLGGARLSFALARLWLAGFDFPHRTYFNARALRKLLEQGGWDVLEMTRESIGSPLSAVSRVGYARPSRKAGNMVVGLAVGCINAIDGVTGYGGLLTAIARVRP